MGTLIMYTWIHDPITHGLNNSLLIRFTIISSSSKYSCWLKKPVKLKRTTDPFFFFLVWFIVWLISVFLSPSSSHAGSFINLTFGTNEKLFHAPVSRSALIRSSLKLSADLIRADSEGEMGKEGEGKKRKRKKKKKSKQIEIVLLQKITWPCSARQTLYVEVCLAL